jgi:hypothetical protein
VGQERLPVRKIREVLRLKAEGFSDRQIVSRLQGARVSCKVLVNQILQPCIP